ncbi:MAG: hypothetical protein ACLSAP_11980 [Oscillospiraceae bacterium]
MKILVVGGGGREHAVIKKLKQSSENPEIYCCPQHVSKEAVCIGQSNRYRRRSAVRKGLPGRPGGCDAGRSACLGMVTLQQAGIRWPKQAAALIEGARCFQKI